MFLWDFTHRSSVNKCGGTLTVNRRNNYIKSRDFEWIRLASTAPNKAWRKEWTFKQVNLTVRAETHQKSSFKLHWVQYVSGLFVLLWFSQILLCFLEGHKHTHRFCFIAICCTWNEELQLRLFDETVSTKIRRTNLSLRCHHKTCYCGLNLAVKRLDWGITWLRGVRVF